MSLMPVYYGGDLCTSDESDWEDPYDIACAKYVEQYNCDALEGMELMVFERLKGPDDSVMMVSERNGTTPVPQWESDTKMHDVPDAAVSPNRRSCSETYDDGTALYYMRGGISDSDCG